MVNADEVDAQLGQHVDGTPRVAVTDGGVNLKESGGDNAEGDRPQECGCVPCMDNLPCWPCYREGYEKPNPHATDENK